MNILAISNNPSRASFRQRIGVYLGTLRSNGINTEVAKLPTGSLARRKLFKRAADFDGVFLHKKGLNFFDAFWLAPLPDNRFTRGKCGFKILQYASAGLPVIASPVGVNTDYIRQGGGCLADAVSDWIDKLCQLMSDSQLRKQVGQISRAKVQQFDLRVLGRVLIRLIKGCIESG